MGRSEVRDALVAALFDRLQLLAIAGEAVAVEFCANEHIFHTVSDSALGAGPVDLKTVCTRCERVIRR
jgi:hypothetical protein